MNNGSHLFEGTIRMRPMFVLFLFRSEQIQLDGGQKYTEISGPERKGIQAGKLLKHEFGENHPQDIASTRPFSCLPI